MAFGYGVYFTERGKNRVVRWEPDTGDAEVVAGEPADGDPSQKLNDPYGLAFDKAGNLIIADKLNSRICRLKKGRLETIPLKDPKGDRARKPDTRRCYSPDFYSPTGLFTEPDGSLICAFSDDYTLYRIRPKGQLELVLGMLRNRNYHFSAPQEKIPASQAMDTPLNGPTGVVERSDGTFFFIERGLQIVRQYHPARGIECIFPRSRASEFFWRDEAPEHALLNEYHPAFPGALALDAEENLYLSEVRHGCVLKVDVGQGMITRVIQLKRPTKAGQSAKPVGGCSAIGFGPDGTAWVLDSANGRVQGYQPRASGEWTPTAETLEEVAGEPLRLPVAGSGIAVGA